MMRVYLPVIRVILVLSSCLIGSNSVFSQDLTKVYNKVSPAVVVIFTRSQHLIEDQEGVKKVTSEGLGSGFLVSERDIITAAHVVSGAEDIYVLFEDSTVVEAKVITLYEGADVALLKLKIPKFNVKPLKLGDSEKTDIGEQVFVVGAPYGLAHSLSSGYVSGKIKADKRSNPFDYNEFIQTDAAINQGNSGGPMFNMKGEVIGVVSNILTQSGGFEGIGFAATSNLTSKLLLTENGIPWIGMEGKPITGEVAKILNLPQQSGLLVERVVPLSSADIMGMSGGTKQVTIDGENYLLGGDIILSFNGIEFDVTEKALNELWKFARNLKKEDSIKIEVLRAGKILTLTN